MALYECNSNIRRNNSWRWSRRKHLRFHSCKSGIKTLLLDRGNFPRVKLCAGWLSPPIWDILGISPNEYTEGLWEWNNVHIHFHGRKYTVKSDGYFIRRYEFDDFLLKRSKVEVVEGHNVRQIEKEAMDIG